MAAGGGGGADNVTFLRSLPDDSILRQLKVKTLEDFKGLLRAKGIEGLPTLQAGAVILQRLIVNKLKKDPNIDQYQDTHEKKKSIVRRLNYFKSSLFIKNFLNPIGTRETLGDKISDSSYSDFYDTLFNVRFTGWRDKKIIKASNQTQCKRALGEEAYGNNMNYIQKNCYICGVDIVSPPHETAECEHVLPIMSAISHLWLTQERIDRYTPDEVEALKLEYAWAHEFCNQIKSNYEFIQLNYLDRQYEVNINLINAYYTKLYSSDDKYDCKEIALKEGAPPIEALIQRIRGITDIINKNIRALDSNLDLYHLLVKFKMISAFTDRVFLSALIGVDDDGEGDLPVYGRSRVIDPEARRAQMIKNKEEEIKIRQAEDPRSWKYNNVNIERRRRMAEAKDLAGERIMARTGRTRYVRVTGRPVIKGLPVRIGKRGRDMQGGGGNTMKEGDGEEEEEEEEGEEGEGEGEGEGEKDLLDGEHYLSEYRSPFDEELTFSKKFLRLVGVPETVLATADMKGIPNLHEFIIKYIIDNEAYNPTQAELDEFIRQEAPVPAVIPSLYPKEKVRFIHIQPLKKRGRYTRPSEESELPEQNEPEPVYGGRRTRKRKISFKRTKKVQKGRKQKQKRTTRR